MGASIPNLIVDWSSVGLICVGVFIVVAGHSFLDMSVIATPIKKRSLLKRVQRDDLVEFLFSISPARVGNLTSKPDSKEFVMYQNSLDLKKMLNADAAARANSEIVIHYTSTRGFIYLEKVVFDPNYVKDRKYVYIAYGWGLFHIHFEPIENSENVICTLSYCNRVNMRETKRLLKEFKSPALWDWEAMELLQSRISGFLDALEWQASR